MRCSRWSSLALSALSVLALAAPADGARLVYADGRLWVAAGDGRGALRIAAPRGLELSEPAWSPDGTRLVVEGSVDLASEGAQSALYVVGADGSGLRALPGGDGLTQPAWSRDGATIAAVRGQTIVALPATGGAVRQLTPGPVDLDPAFSPDGTRLAFTRVTPPETFQVMVAAADGSGARAVARGRDPAWSPDGARIVFVSTADHNGETCFEECTDNGEIHVVGADGSGEQRLTSTKADELAPAWSPDGTRIAYASDRGSSDAGSEVFAMDADGGCVTQLTWGSRSPSAPAWQPGTAPAERGPCGGRAVGYRLDLDLRAARVPKSRPLWFGPRFGERLLSDFGARSLIYAECEGFDIARCAGHVDIQNYRVCTRNPARIDLPASSVDTIRGALAVGYGDQLEVFSGGTDTVIFFASRMTSTLVRRAVAALRPLGSKSASARLPAPRLGHLILSRLRATAQARRDEPLFRQQIIRSDRRILRALERLHATRLPEPACAR